MKSFWLGLAAMAALCVGQAAAQDVTGVWQGTLTVGDKPLRLEMKFAKADTGIKGTLYSIDQGGQALPTGPVTVQGGVVKFEVPTILAKIEGKLSEDKTTIAATWTQGGGAALPIELKHMTEETAWPIPAAVAPPKAMDPKADPSFDVATIKPNNSGSPSMQGLTVRGRNFATVNSSLSDLLQFAYQLQTKQIVNGPDWIEKDRYDISAVPDVEGAPNVEQLRVMVRKLLTERFGLKFHHETKEMSAFVLTVAKGGSKLTPTALQGSLPGMGALPGPDGLSLILRNGTMNDFQGFLQLLILDRPVVNRTALEGKYDLTVKFTPDDSQFHGHPPPLPKPAEGATVEAAPNLFDSLQQQAGLKLSAEKTGVDVIVIDHVDKPTAN